MAKPEQKRPYAVLRALLSIWLVSWFIRLMFLVCKKIIFLFPRLLLTGFKKIRLRTRDIKLKPNISKLSTELQKQISGIDNPTITESAEENEPVLEKKKPIKKRFSFGLKINKLKPVAVFALLAVIFVLPLKAFSVYSGVSDVRGQVLGAAESALTDMGQAAQALVNQDFITAGNEFGLASDNFSSAKKSINNIK